MAVYTTIDDTELSAFLAAYDIGDVLSFSGIAEGVENSNFLLRTTKASYILTLYEKRVDANDLPFFIELMTHLSAAGMDCPVPVAATDGRILHDIAGRNCAVFSFLDGTLSRFPNHTKCSALGASLAELHIKALGVSRYRANALGSASWKPLLASIGADGNFVDKGMYNSINRRLEQILHSWPTDLPRGIIHADLFPNNVLFVGDKLTGLIDFYFACEEILAYDVGICLNSWCFEADGSFNMTKSRALIHGYESVRPLSDAEKKAIPILASGSAMRFFLTRLYDWINTPSNAMVSPKDPMEYWDILDFHQKVSNISAYGIDLTTSGVTF